MTALRATLVAVALAAAALVSPAPWAVLWLAVPPAVAAAMLLAWRFGAPALAFPPALWAGVALVAGPDAAWTWWIPAAALSGAWLGLREEREDLAPSRGAMLFPVLALAALLPWLPGYAAKVERLDRQVSASNAEMLKVAREMGVKPERIEAMKRAVEQDAAVRGKLLPNLVPTLLFGWVALLVVAGRTLAARASDWLRWPAIGRTRLTEWRLPDGAIWVLLAGMGLLVAQWPAWAPTAWTLLINSGLGFCLQGIAVVESLMLARGVPPSVIALTLMFVFALATPMFVFTTAVLGLSDFWLDFRRMEPAPDGDAE